MRQEELLLFGKLQKHYSGSLAENISSLLELVQVLSELIEAVADARIKIPGWRYHSQTLIGKIVFSSRSVLKLTEGIEYDLFSRQERLLINDYSSIFILVRAIIENYLTLCYIYNNKCSEEVKIFR